MNENPIRIIPILDIKNGLLIKGINLEGLRVLGKASNFSNYYYKSRCFEKRSNFVLKPHRARNHLLQSDQRIDPSSIGLGFRENRHPARGARGCS